MRRSSLVLVVVGALEALGSAVAWGGDAPPPALDRDAELRRAVELNQQVVDLWKAGRFGAAEPLAREALAIRERLLGPDDPLVAESWLNLGAQLKGQGRHADARRPYERALAVYEKARGADHPDVALSLNNLASLLSDQGAYDEARPLHERALAIREKALGRDHPDVAQSLNNLALLLQTQGAYAEARPLHERAIAIKERTLGKEHPSLATSLHNLAFLLKAQGAYAEARPLYERALAIREAALGPEHPLVATTLAALAPVLSSQGAHADATRLYERALAICEKALGSDHPAVALHLNNLGFDLKEQGAYAKARPLYERALAIRERALGKDHPDVAQSLNNLAVLLKTQGAYAEARPLYERALTILEKALGEDHPLVAQSAANLAVLLTTQGAHESARPLFERALSIGERHVRAQLSALVAAQRLALVRSVRILLDRWLRFAPRAGLGGHAEALRLRGIVTRAEAAERALARRATDGQRATIASLQAAARLAARLANQPPSKPEARAAWQERYAKAAAERERLTRELSSQMASARTALERLELTEADVHEALSADAALVGVLRVGEQYLAWVLRSTGEPARVELGSSDAIEGACEAFVTVVADDAGDESSREAIAKAGAGLRALVWAPLEGKLGAGVRRVVICPDAALASVPFAALPGRAPGTYLGDEVALSHVFHPFDLVPHAGEGRGVGALVVGGVDYDRAVAGSTETPPPARPPVPASLDRAPRGGAFLPIPATKPEAEALRDRFGKDATTLLLGSDATEARLREGVKGKRFVHVATHGFARTDLLAGLYDRKITDAFLSADAERQLSVGHDPMLLSGLALAGANPRDGAGGDDGILTALEASYLDLDGVDLVTLSACETAKGTAESGEGVLGLVSAFQMAGARGVLASLWKVDDEATQRLMEGVYERMLRKESPLSPADALREAARALRGFTDGAGKARYAAPRYWAAFVAYGG